MCIRDSHVGGRAEDDGLGRSQLFPAAIGQVAFRADGQQAATAAFGHRLGNLLGCLLYTSDAADERSSVDLGGRRILKKKTTTQQHTHTHTQKKKDPTIRVTDLKDTYDDQRQIN